MYSFMLTTNKHHIQHIKPQPSYYAIRLHTRQHVNHKHHIMYTFIHAPAF